MPARRIVQVAGKDVRLLTGGDGPPLLYLHAVGADVDWLEIQWPQPSGKIQRLTDIRIDRYTRIVEGK